MTSKSLLISLLLTFGMVSCSSRNEVASPQHTPEQGQEKSGSDEYGVYSILLQQFPSRDKADVAVILSQTDLFTMDKGDLRGTLKFVSGEIDGGLPKDIMESFETANTHTQILEDHFTTKAKHVLITKAEADDLTANGWTKFLSQYPEGAIVSFSRVAPLSRVSRP